MSEPFDLYADSFMITVTPWGANMTFALQEAVPSGPEASPPKRLGTVRMSTEHLKTVAFMITRHVKEYERGEGVVHPVSRRILNQLSIAPEDWESFWS